MFFQRQVEGSSVWSQPGSQEQLQHLQPGSPTMAQRSQPLPAAGSAHNGLSTEQVDMPSPCPSEESPDPYAVARYMQERGKAKRHTVSIPLERVEDMEAVDTGTKSRKRRSGLLTVAERPPEISREVIMEVEARMNRQYSPLPPQPMMPPSTSVQMPVTRVKSYPRTKWSGLATVQETNRSVQGRDSFKDVNSLHLPLERYSPVRRASEGCAAPSLQRASPGPASCSDASLRQLQLECHQLQRSAAAAECSASLAELQHWHARHMAAQLLCSSSPSSLSPSSPSPSLPSSPAHQPVVQQQQQQQQQDGTNACLAQTLQRLQLQQQQPRGSSPGPISEDAMEHYNISAAAAAAHRPLCNPQISITDELGEVTIPGSDTSTPEAAAGYADFTCSIFPTLSSCDPHGPSITRDLVR
ncbi:hypothetical protein B566_EDAN005003 [Ephemera danica]|nr:hypothetical protein B566_EDAN005003 [Ephemera danica]